MTKKSCILVLFILTGLFLSGCGKKPEDPPRVRISLVMEIFDAVDRNDHAAALEKIRRLQELDKTNVFISEFESLERANLLLHQAQKKLLSGDRRGAELLIAEAIRQGGVHAADSGKSIYAVTRLEDLAEKIRNAKTSDELEQSMEQFLKIACQLNNSGKLIPYAKERLKEVPKLKFRENKISLFDMAADEAILTRSSDPVAPVVKIQRLLEEKKLEK